MTVVGFESPSIATTAGLFTGGKTRRHKKRAGGKSRKSKGSKRTTKKGGYRPKKPRKK